MRIFLFVDLKHYRIGVQKESQPIARSHRTGGLVFLLWHGGVNAAVMQQTLTMPTSFRYGATAVFLGFEFTLLSARNSWTLWECLVSLQENKWMQNTCDCFLKVCHLSDTWTALLQTPSTARVEKCKEKIYIFKKIIKKSAYIELYTMLALSAGH